MTMTLEEYGELSKTALVHCEPLIDKREANALADKIGTLCEESGHDNATVLFALHAIMLLIIKQWVAASALGTEKN